MPQRRIDEPDPPAEARSRDAPTTDPPTPDDARVRRQLSVVFLVLAAVISAIGVGVFHSLSQAILRHENERLLAVADLKATQIGNWLAERRHDALLTTASPLLNEALRNWLAQPQREQEQRLRSWLEFVHALGGYTAIELYDPQGARLFAVGTPPHPQPSFHAAEIRQALNQTEPMLIDFHREPNNGGLHLGYVVAVRDALAPQQPPVGALIFAIDPRPYLYHLIQTWPGPSPSGETLLVRREGDEVVFLNELRHQKDTALRLRLPFGRLDLPAARAFRQEGLFEGRDYRGVRVFSALRQVAGSPWRLVAKVDRAEVVHDIQRLAAISALVVLLVIGSSGALLGLAWQEQRLREARLRTRQAQTIAGLSERFRTLVEGASDAFFAHDLGGRLVEVNQRACDSTGYGRTELLRMRVADLEQEFDPARAAVAWSGLRPGQGLTVYGRYRRKDGTTFPVEARLSRCEIEGQPLILGLVRDISERLRGEQALHESEFLYRELVDNMSSGVAVYEAVDNGQDFVFRDLNRAGERIGQISREQAIGRRVTEVFPGVADLGLLAVFGRVWSSGRPQRHPVGLYRDPRLSQWVENYVFRLPGGEIVAVYDDVTARRQAEQALRESEADLKRAQAVGHIGSWRLDVRRNDLRWSDENYRIFGVPFGTPMTYEAFLACVHPQDRALVDREWRAALGGVPYDIEHRIVVDGEVRWVRERAELEFDAVGVLLGGFGVTQDITDRKRTQEALLRKSEELQRMNAELEEFAYVASHDLKAPLRAVANLALVIDEDVSAGLDEENRSRLRLLRERVKMMDALIEGLLSYARLGYRARATVAVELGGLLREVVDSLSVPAGFRVEWAEPLPTLIADPLELRQIVQNLIGNALAHHDQPQQGQVRVRAEDGGDYWYLEVADNGPGIPEHMRARAFRMFSTGGKPGHTGIGLAVVRKLVVANGGQITVTDQAPRGTLFRIRWPKRPAEPLSATQKK